MCAAVLGGHRAIPWRKIGTLGKAEGQRQLRAATSQGETHKRPTPRPPGARAARVAQELIEAEERERKARVEREEREREKKRKKKEKKEKQKAKKAKAAPAAAAAAPAPSDNDDDELEEEDSIGNLQPSSSGSAHTRALKSLSDPCAWAGAAQQQLGPAASSHCL